MTKTVGLIQARMSSSRFPGKMLAELGGRPMIAFMIDRVRRARSLDLAAVVTSTDLSDDPLAEAASACGFAVFRGDLNDVLERYAAAAEHFAADIVVRMTGDCPLIDPQVVDAVVALRAENGADYASNVAPATFADGWDVECFTRAALERARTEATAQAEREHVTVWMRRDDVGLCHANHTALIDSSHLRLTVDYPDDLAMVARVVDRLGGGTEFDRYDVLRCLDAERALLDINIHARNEGLDKSLGVDATVHSNTLGA